MWNSAWCLILVKTASLLPGPKRIKKAGQSSEDCKYGYGAFLPGLGHNIHGQGSNIHYGVGCDYCGVSG